MDALVFALGAFAIGGVLAAATFRRPKLSGACGIGGCVVAAAVGLPVALSAVAGKLTADLNYPWSTIPGAAFHLGIDSLSGFFLLPIFGIACVTAVFAYAYLTQHEGHRPTGIFWLFF